MSEKIYNLLLNFPEVQYLHHAIELFLDGLDENEDYSEEEIHSINLIRIDLQKMIEENKKDF